VKVNSLNCFKSILLLLIILIVSSSQIYSQVNIRQPKIIFEYLSGYDDNPLSMSNVSDSIKINSFVEKVGAQLSSRVIWNKDVRTSFSLSGDYTLFPANSRFNEWRTDFRIENLTKLYPKYKKSWLPGIYWNIGVDIGAMDQLFTDRVLGDEFESSLSQGEMLKMGDLLDKVTLDYFTGFRFKINNSINFYFKVLLANNNYKNLGTPNNNSFTALDNKDNLLSGELDVDIIDNWSVALNYSSKNRVYDYKYAKQLDKIEIRTKKREYFYSSLGISSKINFKNIKLILGYSLRDRDDRFEGYYNYNASNFKTKFVYSLAQNLDLLLGISISNKDYSNLTLSKKILNNTYNLYTFSFAYGIYKDLTIIPAYIYDKEKSTYYKFSYTRNFFSIKANYKF